MWFSRQATRCSPHPGHRQACSGCKNVGLVRVETGETSCRTYFSGTAGPGSSVYRLCGLAGAAWSLLGEAVGLQSVVVECSPSWAVAVGSVGGARVLGKVRERRSSRCGRKFEGPSNGTGIISPHQEDLREAARRCVLAAARSSLCQRQGLGVLPQGALRDSARYASFARSVL